MRLRLAWVADCEYADSPAASESRVLLRALARNHELVPLWFAVGSDDPPHTWNGVRVFPVPAGSLHSAEFLATLIQQQRPHVVLWDLPRSAFPAGIEHLSRNGATWIRRVNPEEDVAFELPRSASAILVCEEGQAARLPGCRLVPHLSSSSDRPSPADPRAIVDAVAQTILSQAAVAPASGERYPAHLVMRQHLFCNTSVAHVMFELTNALIELGVPTIPQEEHLAFSKSYIHREEALFREGAPAKHERIRRRLGGAYDPENAVTVHFTLFQPGVRNAQHAVFPALSGREVLYTTGNHTVTAQQVRELLASFDMILAPSRHVLRPYLEAGLGNRQGAVVPHGIDPKEFSPAASPFPYPTEKRFKFLQTSFPWVYEKGFDLTLRAFGQAFSAADDVALILRVPRLRSGKERKASLGRLENLVSDERRNPRAPEILLLEEDVLLDRRGGLYTGANCYVHPLRAEGFGMIILEAMACGLPVIATPWSGPSDFLSPSYAYALQHSSPTAEAAKDGAIRRYHVEPDVDHLVHLMRYADEHQEGARAMGRRAGAVARRDWTWEHAARKLAGLFGLS
jgi:glycosyltransferase involved in cell wall biosynthesis